MGAEDPLLCGIRPMRARVRGLRPDQRLAVAVVLAQGLLQFLRRKRRCRKDLGVRGQAGRDVVCEAQNVGLDCGERRYGNAFTKSRDLRRTVEDGMGLW